MSRQHLSFVAGLLVVVGVFGSFVACQGSGVTGPVGEPEPGATQFLSDDPLATSGGSDLSGGADAGTAADTGTSAPPTDAGPKTDEAARAIEEADVVKVAGTRLYALSKVGGLSIVDVGTRDKLSLLGRWRTPGRPFEMYVRDGVVFAMIDGFPDWSYDGWVGGTVRQTGKVVALDVRDPQAIKNLGEFLVPGEVSDSRIVGDVLYVVSHQNGSCWNCAARPGTFVMSLNVKEPRAIAEIDQLGFTTETVGWSYWRRSVSATDKRLWIGGPDWSWTTGSKPRSTIQALDVSDPTGKLVLGAAVTLDGQIQSRWQMDEVGGVLRVITQPGGWTGLEPIVETFTVESSTKVTPLGRTTIKLPRPETLMSVRFDGTRGYAITTERKDPLFTIDLTDPAKPKQMGELEMPGWIMYLEPRGDRLLGLGFDNGNPEGAMTVSLFDVADLAAPKMLKRVNFGKGWASAPEDADRIHKAFRVLDAEKLILVPFSSYDWRSSDGKCHRAESGVQLVDWKDDSLTLRGVAEIWGQPRRALLHDGRLFAISDTQVATFDIADRGKPLPKAQISLANPSHKAVVVGEHLVQLSHDWFTQHAKIVVMPRKDLDRAVPTGTLDLSPMLGVDTCGYYGWTSWWNARLFVRGTKVVVVVPTYGYYGGKGAPTLIGVVDLSDPSRPTLVGKASLSLGGDGDYGYGAVYGDGAYGYGYGGGAVLSAGDSLVLAGDTLVRLASTRTWDSVTRAYGPAVTTLSTVDLRDPASPRAGATTTLSAASGYTALQVAGTKVVTSRWVPFADGKVQFFVDEIDVADPAAPRVVRSINVPGSLLAWDGEGRRVLTVDYRRTAFATDSYATCDAAASKGDVTVFSWEDKQCIVVHRVLRRLAVEGGVATLLDSAELPKGVVTGARVGGARVVLAGSEALTVVDGLRAPSISSRPIALPGKSYGYYYSYGSSFWMDGTRAAALSGGRLYTLDLDKAVVRNTTPLETGYYATDVSFAPDAMYVSLGDLGAFAL